MENFRKSFYIVHHQAAEGGGYFEQTYILSSFENVQKIVMSTLTDDKYLPLGYGLLVTIFTVQEGALAQEVYIYNYAQITLGDYKGAFVFNEEEWLFKNESFTEDEQYVFDELLIEAEQNGLYNPKEYKVIIDWGKAAIENLKGTIAKQDDVIPRNYLEAIANYEINNVKLGFVEKEITELTLMKMLK
jgi:hypothetical protein